MKEVTHGVVAWRLEFFLLRRRQLLYLGGDFW